MSSTTLWLVLWEAAQAGVYDPLIQPFSATPEQLRAASDAVAALPWERPEPPRKPDAAKPEKKEKPKKDDEKPPTVEVLHRVEVHFDDAGLTTTTQHDIWRIDRDDTALRTDTMYWDPWREDRPQVELRVVGTDGKERRLDPSTLVEQSAATGIGETYVDTRKLIAPLPGARKGAIVEQKETVTQRAPFLDGGQSGYIPITVNRIGRVEVVLDAPVGLPLNVDARNLGTMKETRKGGRRTLRWVVENPERLVWPQDLAPREAYNVRYVSWSTAPDWGSVARAYDKIVDLKAVLPPEAVEAAKSIRAREADDRRAATAMALWINERARYVAVELGASAVVPRLPSDVLSRGYGDCKDKATFLVAMLRSAGVRAHVVLLRAGWDPDVDPKLPGPNLFNHAITLLDGRAEPIWVDPTHPELPAGLLPESDADHWALVAAPDTTALIRTPPQRPILVQLDKVVRAPDHGRADVWQTIRFRPENAADLRERARTAGVESLVEDSRANLIDSGRARSVDVTYDLDLVDLDRDVTETLDARGVSDFVVAPGDLTMKLGPGFSMNALPTRWQLGLFEDDILRSWPLELRPIEQVASLEVHPPRGYTLDALPKPVDITWPGGGFHWAWTALEGGAVRGQAKIAVPRAMSLADMDTFLKAADSAREAAELQLRFLNEPKRLAEAGHISASLRAWARVASAPDALVADRVGYAQALYDAGYAGRAREVLAAVPMDDDTEVLPVTLGWDAVSHVEYGFGLARRFDPRPIQASTRKLMEAKQAADKEGEAEFYRGLLARISLFDDQGVYGRGDLEAVLALAGDDLSLLRSPTALLLRNGDGERVKETTKWARDDRALGERVAGFVLADGVEAAQKEASAQAADGAQLRRVYTSAISALSYARQWDAARQVAALVPDTPEAKDLSPEVRRWTEHDLGADTPVAAFRRFVLAQGDPAHEAELHTTAVASALEPDTVWTWSGGGGTATDYLLDRAMSPRRVEVDGDAAGGYRLRMEPLWSTAKFRYYVVKEKGTLRLRAQAGQWDELGEEAAARLDAGRLADAQRWLDWALLDPDRPAPSRYAGLWTADGDRGADRARLLAALLAARGREGKRHQKTLQAAWAAHTADAAVGPALVAVFERNGDHAAALAVAEELQTRLPGDPSVVGLRVTALARLGRAADAEAAARAALAGTQDTADTWTSMISALSDGGAFEAAVKLGLEGSARFPREESLLNQVAWPMLFLPALPAEADDFADRIVAEEWSSSRAHTSACLYAALGQTDEARKLVQRHVDEHDGDMDSAWSFVWGRIAEADGELAVARKAYLAVEDDTEGASSVKVLAQRRLAVIGSK